MDDALKDACYRMADAEGYPATVAQVARGPVVPTEQLLDEMRAALTQAWTLERNGLHRMAAAWGQLAAEKLEQALAADWVRP